MATPETGPEAHHIEPAEGNSDVSDSAYGDENASITTSLKSSVLNYKFENGRRYHAFGDGPYYLPNDEAESERLDLFHHILTMRCGGKLHLAPIGSNPQRILDLGTGTGIWAIDMGDKYPSAEILGNDLSPIQPTLVAPNIRFEIDDMEKEWIYSSKFDFIHARALAGCVKDWPKLLRQAFEFTKPGGWVEFQDFDMRFYTTTGDFKRGCPLDQWTTELIEGLKVFGVEAEPGPKLEGWVKDAGFVKVHDQVLPVPVGAWPKDRKMKDIGAFNYHHFLDGLEGISLRVLTNGRGMTAEEVQVFLIDVRNDLKNPTLRAQHNFHVVYAQKPLDVED